MSETVQPATKSTATAAAIESDQESSGVCPFCGTVVAAPQSACTRCGMENTPVTRQATRARLGPWYVLQTRNPSAPGMRYATLLSLVAKGRITARSIVRGPTTSQFWKPATQVRGLSRHFAVCYACGGHIAPADKTCSHCERSQEPPADPDVLLDSADGAAPAGRMGPAVFRQVPPEAAALAAISGDVPAAANSDPLAVRAGDSTGLASPESKNGGGAGDPLARANTAASRRKAPAGDLTPNLGNLSGAAGRPGGGGGDPIEPGRGRDDGESERPIEDRILSPRDLAAAFSMDFDARKPARRRRRNTGSLVAVSLLLAFLVAAVVVLAVPSLRTSVQFQCNQWYEALVAEQGIPTIPPPISPPPATPAKAADGGGTTNVHPAPAPAGAGIASAPGGAPAGSGTDPSPRSPSAGGSLDGASTIASAPGGTSPRSAGPAQSPGISTPPVADPMVAPSPSSTQPADRSNLPATDADYAMSKSLRNAGLDAESRGDYAAAEADYVAIERLPREAWTPNVELLLAQVRKKLNK